MLRADAFYTRREVIWYGQRGEPARWREEDRSLACLGAGTGEGPALFMAFNAATETAVFSPPLHPAGQRWQVAIATATEVAGELVAPQRVPMGDPGQTLCLPQCSLAVLVAHST